MGWERTSDSRRRWHAAAQTVFEQTAQNRGTRDDFFRVPLQGVLTGRNSRVPRTPAGVFLPTKRWARQRRTALTSFNVAVPLVQRLLPESPSQE